MGRRRHPPPKPLPEVPPGRKAQRAEQRRQAALAREAQGPAAQERAREARLELATGSDPEMDEELLRKRPGRSNTRALHRMIGLLALTAGLKVR